MVPHRHLQWYLSLSLSLLLLLSPLSSPPSSLGPDLAKGDTARARGQIRCRYGCFARHLPCANKFRRIAWTALVRRCHGIYTCHVCMWWLVNHGTEACLDRMSFTPQMPARSFQRFMASPFAFRPPSPLLCLSSHCTPHRHPSLPHPLFATVPVSTLFHCTPCSQDSPGQESGLRLPWAHLSGTRALFAQPHLPLPSPPSSATSPPQGGTMRARRTRMWIP